MTQKTNDPRENDNPAVDCLVISPELRVGGGPGGYLFHLRRGIEKIGAKSIVFLELTEKKGIEKKQEKKWTKFLKEAINVFKTRKIKILLDLSLYLAHKCTIEREYNKKVSKIYRAIEKLHPKILHFHDPFLLYYFVKNAKYKKRFIILLTWHSPSGFNEIRMRIKYRFNFDNPPIFSKMIREVLVEGIRAADYFLVPSNNCFDSQIRYLPESKPSIVDNKIKLFYSGIDKESIKSTLSKDTFLKKYNIPSGRKIISFIGRGHYDKGFDLFVEVAKKFENDPSVIFVKSGALFDTSLKMPKNLIVLGWLDNVYDFVSATDVVMMPNRSTFFDLLLLEALSFGKIIVTTDVGGHKEFKNITPGVFLTQPRLTDLKNCLEKVLRFNTEEYKKCIDQNLVAYNEYFTAIAFAKRYLNIINECIKEFKKI